MSRVFWDTNLFIYLFEDNGALSKAVAQFVRRCSSGAINCRLPPSRSARYW